MPKRTQCPLPGKPHMHKHGGRWGLLLPRDIAYSGAYAAAIANVDMRNGARPMVAVRVDGVRYGTLDDALDALKVPGRNRPRFREVMHAYGGVRYVKRPDMPSWREHRIAWCL